jgi:LmbE family N-acetylglucosaminyl deacetylase
MRELGLEMPWRRDEEGGDTEPTWGLPDDEIGAMVDIRGQLDRKRESLLAHRTQIKPDMWMLTLPHDTFETFLGYETFQQVRPSRDPGPADADLFAGLTAAVAVS